jgi:GNAT superfamily N-acetyltransferase
VVLINSVGLCRASHHKPLHPSNPPPTRQEKWIDQLTWLMPQCGRPVRAEAYWATLCRSVATQMSLCPGDGAWQDFQHGYRVHALVTRFDGRLLGIAHFLVHASTTSPDVCYLQDLFTAPEARGKGVARALIRVIEAWARHQVKVIRLLSSGKPSSLEAPRCGVHYGA